MYIIPVQPRPYLVKLPQDCLKIICLPEILSSCHRGLDLALGKGFSLDIRLRLGIHLQLALDLSLGPCRNLAQGLCLGFDLGPSLCDAYRMQTI